MTVEELLHPRIKVIADYPGATFKVGSIRDLDESAHYIQHHDELDYNKYPHLFRKLEWWEEREISDLPDYVRFKALVYKVKDKRKNSHTSTNELGGIANAWQYCLPATKEEYDSQYIN